MYLCATVFIWFSFLYRNSDCAVYDVQTGKLTQDQQRQLYNELEGLSHQKRKQLFGDLERQRQEFELSSSKWARLRETQAEDSSFVSQTEVDTLRKSIRNGGSPVVRNKRTLKFLVKSLAEILGLRWTLLKYSLIPGVVNSVIGPPPASPAAPGKPAAPAAPAAPAPPPPRPKNPPPPPPPRNPPPAPRNPPPKAPPPTAPAAPPPTIPQNQIDPNTIRYPFRPAPTIPFLNFAPLPAGVTVPYPPLFQWPTPAPAMPTQPPCAAPPAKNPPPPPSRLPLPKPRPPVPPPPPPVKPVLPASPGKTPVKLEYDHPVRIEIFNNIKPYLPASGSVYSGEPTLTSLEEQDEHEQFLNPTQAIQDIDDHYTNTENSDSTEDSRNYHDDNSQNDDDYGFLTKVPKYFSQTTPEQSADYDHTERFTDEEHYEETTPTSQENFVSHNAFDDYPEQAEENRANVNVKVRHSSPKKPRILKPRKNFYDSRRNIHSVFNQTSPSWKSQSFPPTTAFPKNHAEKWRNPTKRLVLRKTKQFEPTTPRNTFRIIVPDSPRRKRRETFSDEDFNDFDSSAFDSFNEEVTEEAESIPEDIHKLEKSVEKYVEKFVEHQISAGQIDVTKPKTTVIELQREAGPPIKTITTTFSEIVDGDKSLEESIIEYSKNINPISNIAESVHEQDQQDEPAQQSEKLSEDEEFFFDTPISWHWTS